jgi:putative membrane protein
MNAAKLLTLPALLALAFSFGAAQAQGSGPGNSATGGQSAPMAQPGTGTRNTPVNKAKMAHGDRKFIEKAAEAGMFEVQAGQLASSKASDPQVKSFAGMLVDQHTAANNELTQLANAKGVELPPAPKHSMRKDIEKLGKKNGAEFDRAFVREVGIKSHQKAIKDFQKASKDVKDADLKAWVDKTLPALQEHLAMAEKLPESGKNAAAMGASKH